VKILNLAKDRRFMKWIKDHNRMMLEVRTVTDAFLIPPKDNRMIL